MAIIISLLMSLGIFTNDVHSTANTTNAPDSKHQYDNSTSRTNWEWDGSN